MGTKNIKSKAFRIGAFVLANGTAMLSAGCNSNSVESLFFTVKGDNLEVTFCDRGASIYSIKYKDKDVTYHPQDKKEFVDKGYYGKCLGRVAGRIPDGDLYVDHKEYKLDINETKNGKNNCLHGGTNGLASKDWTHTIVKKTNYTEVTFKYLSNEGEAGFPEVLNVRYKYKIWNTQGKDEQEHDDLDLDIDAGSSGLTPANLSIHPFFRLNDSNTYLYGNNKEDRDATNAHKMVIKTKWLAKYDDEGHQTVEGENEIGNDSPYNFQTNKAISYEVLTKAKELDAISNGFDNIWHFTSSESEDGTIRNGDFELSGPLATLKVTSDADALIMYSNCWPEANMKMNGGEDDDYYKAITVEPYKFFTTEQKSIEKMFIDKGNSFSRHMTYSFSDTKR